MGWLPHQCTILGYFCVAVHLHAHSILRKPQDSFKFTSTNKLKTCLDMLLECRTHFERKISLNQQIYYHLNYKVVQI